MMRVSCCAVWWVVSLCVWCAVSCCVLVVVCDVVRQAQSVMLSAMSACVVVCVMVVGF